MDVKNNFKILLDRIPENVFNSTWRQLMVEGYQDLKINKWLRGTLDIKDLGIPNLCFSSSSSDKHKKQRISRGFDDSEILDLKSVLCKWLSPRVAELHKLKPSEELEAIKTTLDKGEIPDNLESVLSKKEYAK